MMGFGQVGLCRQVGKLLQSDSEICFPAESLVAVEILELRSFFLC